MYHNRFQRKKRLARVLEAKDEDEVEDDVKPLKLAIVCPGAFVEWNPSMIYSDTTRRLEVDTAGQLFVPAPLVKSSSHHKVDSRRRLSQPESSFGRDTTTDDLQDTESLASEVINGIQKVLRNRSSLKVQQHKDADACEKASYRLISLEGKGEAELIRLLFITAGMRYEDTRVTEEEWEEMKESTPYGTLPILTKCGKQWGEASAIIRTLAKKFLLLGTTNEDHLTTEATYERLRRLQLEHNKAINWVKFGEKNKEKMEWAQSQLTHVILPSAFKEWEAQILSGPGPFIITNGMTVADIAIMDFVDQCSSNLIIAPILADFPAVSDLLTMVRTQPNIQAYLDERAKE